MVNELIKTIPGLVAGGAVTRYHIVKLSGDNAVAVATADTAPLLGIAASDAASGEAVAVAGPRSIVGCVAGAQVTAGSYVTAGAGGVGVVSNPGATVNSNVVGIALTGASAAGEYFSVLVLPQRIQGAGTL
ncbi:MAG TPA: DUF2190 family protein [Bacillota bacterium]|nr:DUF2190 family protein [Bacillota bacterium]